MPGKTTKSQNEISPGFVKNSVNALLIGLPVVHQFSGATVLVIGSAMIGVPLWRQGNVNTIYLIIGTSFVAAGICLIMFPRKPTSDIVKTEERFTSTLSGFVDIHSKTLDDARGQLVKKLDDAVKQHLEKLLREELRLVAAVEDATRRVLKGFPEIFDRAFTLIKKAELEDREIWIVNFVLNFGKPHLVNSQVTKEYKELTGRDLEEDVKTFTLKLKRAMTGARSVNLLTITDGETETFLRQLGQQAGYEDLKDWEKCEKLCHQIITQKAGFKDVAKHREGGLSGKFRLYETQSLPIQLLIAGIPGRDGSNEERYGCLVFMVGTEVVGSGIVSGYYTELDTIVSVYKNFASALMENAKRQHEKLPAERKHEVAIYEHS